MLMTAPAQIVATKLVALLPILAAAGETATGVLTDRWSPLINLGAIGCVLIWFLVKTEPRLRRMEQAIDRQSKSLMIAVISMRGVEGPVKEQAQAMLDEIKSAEERREQ
jgi:hypothetical protein